MDQNMLFVSHLSKDFEHGQSYKSVVLDNITFSVHQGEVMCLIGPNACGKSTLLQIAAGLIEPTRGKILHNGAPIKSPEWNRTLIFQDLNLFPWKNIAENIEFGLKAKGLKKEEQICTTKKYLELLKINQFANYYPNQLSGGTKQKAAIARALALEPDILLMDEPFSSLDMQSREFLQEELLNIVKERNQTTLFVTHSIDEALFLADKIVVLSSSPARVKAVIKILKKDKEDPEFRHSGSFLQYKKRIWKLLREEYKHA